MDIDQLLSEAKAAYEAQVATLQQMIDYLKALTASLEESIRQKDRLIEELRQQNACFQKVIFGSRSEKIIYVTPGQKSLFDRPNAENSYDSGTANAPKQNVVQVPAHERKPKRSQKEIYANLPHTEEIIDLPESEKSDANGFPLIRIGKEFVRTEIRSTPAQHRCVDIYVMKYKVDNPRDEVNQFVRPNVPSPLIEHSFASASTVSLVICNKYFSGLPLYRQEQMFKQQGFSLSRAVMANWVITVSELYLEKIYLRLCRLIVLQPVIHADETPIQVLKEKGRKPQQKSYMWVYATSKRSDIQIRCYSYEDSRSGECACRFLSDFTGVLISDGYSGYLRVDVIRAGCWAHMRRKWVEAMPSGVSSENTAAAIGLDYCNRLFSFEQRIEKLSDKERTIERQKSHSPSGQKPGDELEPLSAKEILREYWTWIDSLGVTTGKLKRAVTYARNQKQYLESFLEHGEIEISNNQVENAIRPFVVGRKGWLFSDTPQGARASAVVYSLIETAKANDLNAGAWLEHVLTVLPERFAYNPDDCVDDLLPWAGAMQAKFKLKN